MNETITISILGQELTLQAESKTAQEVADLLMQRVTLVENQLGGQARQTSRFAILTLAALNITSEYIDYRIRQEQNNRHLSDRMETLKAQVEKVIDEEAP